MTPVAMQEYMAYPNKNQTGQPTCYVVDRLISPTLIVWPVPTAQFTAVFFRSESMMQDIGTMRNSAPVPVRFMEPLTAGLAHALAIKTPELPVEKIQILKNNYEQEVTNAMGKDVEKFVPLRIYGDYTQGWGSSP
jgi:hypothetical protein